VGSLNKKHALLAILWAVILNAVVALLALAESKIYGSQFLVMFFLPGLLPAVAIAMLISGNVHNMSEVLIFTCAPIFNVLICAGIIYRYLKRKTPVEQALHR
jgi:hypothetical protein